MNYKILLKTVTGDFIYIVNMTKPETINRHLEIHEKTLEE